jgi:hypothetical protein
MFSGRDDLKVDVFLLRANMLTEESSSVPIFPDPERLVLAVMENRGNERHNVELHVY